jgi:hypothetical protein
MKAYTLLMTAMLIGAMALPALAFDVDRDIRIVNTSALDTFRYRSHLSDDDLRRLAELSVSENPEIFPTIKSFEAEYDMSNLTFTSSIDPETEEFEFISMSYYPEAGKYDIAVISPGGEIMRYDREVIVDYEDRTIDTYEPIPIDENDVVLLFAKEYVEIRFEGVEKDDTIGGAPSRGSTPGQPGGGGNNRGGNQPGAKGP